MEISPRLPAAAVWPGRAGARMVVLAPHSPATALVPLLTSDTRHITAQMMVASRVRPTVTVGGGAVRHCYFSSPTLTLLIWSFVSEPFPPSLEPVACRRLMAGAVLCQLQCLPRSEVSSLRWFIRGGTLDAVFMAELGLGLR